jgi:hypothetical protein
VPEELIEIKGLEETCRFLETAPKEVVGRALLAGLAAWAQVMEAAIIGEPIPIRAIRIGGDADSPPLVEDLGIEIILDPGGRAGIVKVGFGKEGSVARFVEYGHREVAHGKSVESRKQIGQAKEHPFMRPAADQGGEAALDAYVAAFYDEMQKGGLVDG